ncbi:hypothetical protein P389DRAFT_165676 [Cystobasidium minutum MCA 4210]|uniref:uncharacterized protein n=1 Tax=Cystobasidium minutum MCA 4210 TaxID=1397322 RepID=UPI0034CD70C3|eukprot:jgi/Rhomi1/165676/fgenesh1_kg.1_\
MLWYARELSCCRDYRCHRRPTAGRKNPADPPMARMRRFDWACNLHQVSQGIANPPKEFQQLTTIYLSMLQEYHKIWKSKGYLVKYLYLCNRYLPLFACFFVLAGFGVEWTIEKCTKLLLPWETILPTLGGACGSALLLVRCHVIWAHSRRILAILIALYATRAGVVIYYVAGVGILHRPEGVQRAACIPMDSPKTLGILCLVPLGYDILVCCLFLFRAFQLREEMPDNPRSILHTITKHGGLYLIAMIVVNFVHFGWMKLASGLTAVRYVPFAGAYICFGLESIFAARLVLACKSSEQKPAVSEEIGYSHSCTIARPGGIRTILSSHSHKSRVVSTVPPSRAELVSTCPSISDDDKVEGGGGITPSSYPMTVISHAEKTDDMETYEQ